MPSADSAIPICGITLPARTVFAISGLDGSGKDMSDHYDKIREDAVFRREAAERVGIGFQLPEPPIVPNVGNVPSPSEQAEAVTE
jgi:hypothetical protein